MKLISIFLLSFMFAGCVKDKTPTGPSDEMPPSSSAYLYTGTFINGPYGSVSGKAHISRDSAGVFNLVFENLASTNGPDLNVYLSKEIQPVNFINLGALKSVNGNQVYDIPGSPDFMEYRYALVHCRAYNHLFGFALLNKN